MSSQLRGKIGMSQYFGGAYQGYGRYQWSIKYYGFKHEDEIEAAQLWAFGDWVKQGTKASNGNTLRGFDGISNLLGRPIESGTEGRSGGWLVIYTELTGEELTKIDEHVRCCMEALPTFTAEEREFHKSENAEENTHHSED